ncbi:hypothetical protein AQ725_22060 [Burkholderia pseudomallei]|nr:hypothetical protein AQ725_22060 [Burkholderia pseudomallei]
MDGCSDKPSSLHQSARASMTIIALPPPSKCFHTMLVSLIDIGLLPITCSLAGQFECAKVALPNGVLLLFARPLTVLVHASGRHFLHLAAFFFSIQHSGPRRRNSAFIDQALGTPLSRIAWISRSTLS